MRGQCAADYVDDKGREVATPILLPLVISLILTVAGVIGIYILLRGTKFRTSTPKTIDFDFFEKYSTIRRKKGKLAMRVERRYGSTLLSVSRKQG